MSEVSGVSEVSVLESSLVQGKVQKLQGSFKHSHPIEYVWPIGDTALPLNPQLGKKITVQFLQTIECTHCHRRIKKTFNQGYCYPCFVRLARCDLCILKPELCHERLGTCREPEWGQANCMIPHVVYLANTSGLKVGITRKTQIPNRWIDQGAIQAIPLLSVTSRYHSGLVEDKMRAFVNDKTQWRQMLRSDIAVLNMAEEREKLMALASEPLNALDIPWTLCETPAVELVYPVLEFPNKVQALKLTDAQPIEGTFLGVKGQYMILDTGVFNVRALAGYSVSVSFES